MSIHLQRSGNGRVRAPMSLAAICPGASDGRWSCLMSQNVDSLLVSIGFSHGGSHDLNNINKESVYCLTLYRQMSCHRPVADTVVRHCTDCKVRFLYSSRETSTVQYKWWLWLFERDLEFGVRRTNAWCIITDYEYTWCAQCNVWAAGPCLDQLLGELAACDDL